MGTERTTGERRRLRVSGAFPAGKPVHPTVTVWQEQEWTGDGWRVVAQAPTADDLDRLLGRP